jgi:hypothetical protein
MKVMKGTVVSGKVVVDGLLPEGAQVTLLVTEGEHFTLTSEDESALLEAIKEADRGEVVDADQVLRKLGSGG